MLVALGHGVLIKQGALLQGNLNKCLNIIDEIDSTEKSISKVIEELLVYLKKILLKNIALNDKNPIIDITLDLMNELNLEQNKIKNSRDQRLALELLCIKRYNNTQTNVRVELEKKSEQV